MLKQQVILRHNPGIVVAVPADRTILGLRGSRKGNLTTNSEGSEITRKQPVIHMLSLEENYQMRLNWSPPKWRQATQFDLLSSIFEFLYHSHL